MGQRASVTCKFDRVEALPTEGDLLCGVDESGIGVVYPHVVADVEAALDVEVVGLDDQFVLRARVLVEQEGGPGVGVDDRRVRLRGEPGELEIVTVDVLVRVQARRDVRGASGDRLALPLGEQHHAGAEVLHVPADTESARHRLDTGRVLARRLAGDHTSRVGDVQIRSQARRPGCRRR
jgi:hypothetical protein